MRVVLLSPPGAGKGTQGARIAERYSLPYLSTGELFRAEIERGTPLGKRVRGYLEAGDLVPDDVVLEIVRDRVLSASDDDGYVLDGFPRTLSQGERAYEMALAHGGVPDVVIFIEGDEDELTRRMLARAEQEGRADDNEATIRHRFKVYDEQTAPLLEFYKDRGLLRRVDGMQPMDDVSGEIFALLDEVAGSAGSA